MNLDSLDWNNTVEWNNEFDLLIQMAELKWNDAQTYIAL